MQHLITGVVSRGKSRNVKCVISSLVREPEKYVRSLRWQEMFQGFRQVGAPGGQEEGPPEQPPLGAGEVLWGWFQLGTGAEQSPCHSVVSH